MTDTYPNLDKVHVLLEEMERKLAKVAADLDGAIMFAGIDAPLLTKVQSMEYLVRRARERIG